MKTLTKSIIAVIGFSIPFSLFAAAVEYTLDPSHTFVLWHINHFGFSNPAGKWMIEEGTLSFDNEKLENSKVNVKIKVADVITGIPKLDNHIKSKDFLDAAKFPQATFVSDKIDALDTKTAIVHGILTVHGVSKVITLDMKVNKAGMSPVSNKETVGFSGHTKIKRSDFGINAYLPGLGDEVTLEIEAEAVKK